MALRPDGIQSERGLRLRGLTEDPEGTPAAIYSGRYTLGTSETQFRPLIGDATGGTESGDNVGDAVAPIKLNIKCSEDWYFATEATGTADATTTERITIAADAWFSFGIDERALNSSTRLDFYAKASSNATMEFYYSNI